MRESSDGRHTVLPWSEPPNVEPPRFAVGDVVYSEPYADVTGTVVSVSTVVAPLVEVVWSDGDGGAIIYPMEASFLRKVEKLPWQ